MRPGTWFLLVLVCLMPQPGQAQEPRRSRVSADAVFSLDWRRPLVRMGADRQVGISFGQPAIDLRAGLVLVGTGEGELRAYTLADGTPRWRLRHGEPFETGLTLVARPDGRAWVVAGARDGTLLAVRSDDGAEIWRLALGADVRAAPLRIGDGLLVTTANNQVNSLDLATGAIRWSYAGTPPHGLTVAGHARAQAGGGRVYASFSDGQVVALDGAQGSELWRRQLSPSAHAFRDADADPILADGRLYVASYGDGIYALDAADGSVLWHHPARHVTQLARLATTLLVGDGDGQVQGLAPATGERTFRLRLGTGAISRPVVDGERAIMAAGRHGLVVLDGRDGRPLQASRLPAVVGGDICLAGDWLALVSENGYLYAWRRG